METVTLKQKYETELRKTLLEDLGYQNYLQVPKLDKVVLNVGVGRDSGDQKVLDTVTANLKQISGQTPQIRKARKAIAGFKLREGQIVGLRVTLRGKRMYDFLQKLTMVVFPRMRDFRGLPVANFDKNGNYSLGFSEQIVFPEIDMGNMTKTHGVEITIVTTAKNKEEAIKLMTLLGFKFKEGNN
jgi:large subunit ribosomal protein L5